MTTKAAQRQRWATLAPVRRAIHGWAFATPTRLASMILQAETALQTLPPSVHAEGNALIQPLRDTQAPPKAGAAPQEGG